MGLAILGSSSENRNKTETQNVSGGAADNAFNLSTSNSEVVVTDGGAIDGVFNAVKSFLTSTENIVKNNAITTKDIFKSAATNNRMILDRALTGNATTTQESVRSVAGLAKQAQSGDSGLMTKVALYGLLTAGAVAGVKAWKGKA